PLTTDTCDPVAGCHHDIMIAGTNLAMKRSVVPPHPVKMKLLTKGTIALNPPPSNGSADDPVIHGGSLWVVMSVSELNDRMYPLPDSKWSYIRREGENFGYRYVDGSALPGPVRAVTVRDGKANTMRTILPGLADSLGGDPEPVAVILS